VIDIDDIGREDAPIGSEDWAKRVRLHMQALVNDALTKPEAVADYLAIMNEHRAWTLLKNAKGKPFATFKDFCETPQPYGLGKPEAWVKAITAIVKGKTASELDTVAPAQSPPGKTLEKSAPGADNSRKDQLLRAILRAPVEVQDLYREELISQKIAAALGPKNPAKAPSREVIVDALRDVPRERKAIDAKMREVLGHKRDKVNDLVRAFLRLSDKERHRFYEEVDRALKR
jgi:hypothetical protein